MTDEGYTTERNYGVSIRMNLASLEIASNVIKVISLFLRLLVA